MSSSPAKPPPSLLSGPFSGPSSTSPSKKNTSSSTETPSPMPVELFTAIGENVPMLVMNRRVESGSRKRKQMGDEAISSSSTARWQWKAFENQARKDNLRLSHWERVPSSPSGIPESTAETETETNVYHFSRFNTSTNIYSYSSEEYLNHLRDESGDWSREETDYLFGLCHEYDLRWFVVKDRWEWPQVTQGEGEQEEEGASGATQEVAGQPTIASGEGLQVSKKEQEQPAQRQQPGSQDDTVPSGNGNGETVLGAQIQPTSTTTPSTATAEPSTAVATVAQTTPATAGPATKPKERSIEEMKDRYYSVCRRLIRARPASDETAKAALLSSYIFEKDRESARKHHIQNVLLNLTPSQLAEEEFLYIESRRLEQRYSPITRERDSLHRLLGGVGPQSTSALALNGLNGLGGGTFLSAQAQMNAANAAGQMGINVSGLISSSNKKRRRGELDMLEDPTGRGIAGGMGGLGGSIGPGGSVTPAIPQLTPEQEAQYGITRYDLLGGGVAGGLASSTMKSTSVILRSSKPPSLKTSLAPKIITVLQELSVNMRLAMPTRGNMDKLEALTQAITALLDVKKQVERAEHESKILKTRKEASNRVDEEDRLQQRANQLEVPAMIEREGSGADTGEALTPQGERGSTASSGMQVDG